MHGSKRLAASGLVFASVFGVLSAANAADVYRRETGGGLKDDVAPIVAASWAGLYVGGSVGYGWGDFKDSFPHLEGSPSQSNPLDGVVFGGHIGYNFQRGNIVFGVEAGFNGTDMDADTFNHQVKNELDWYATGIGRLGYAFDGFLLYGFGGVAWGDVKTKILGDSDSATHVGWTAGAGIEKAINDRFSLRLEYSHVDFGTETVVAAGFEDKVDASFDAVKLGVSYKLTGDRDLEPLK